LQRLIAEHQARHQHFDVRDAYKLIYQGIFGVAHILENREAAQQYLQTEFDAVEPSPNEPLLEEISLNGEVVRVNLRPFKAQQFPLHRLFEVMVQTAEEIQGSQEEFMRLWGQFTTLVREKRLAFDRQTLDTFDAEVRAANYPPVHHSEGYKRANRPAYRVVKRSIFQRMFRPGNTSPSERLERHQ